MKQAWMKRLPWGLAAIVLVACVGPQGRSVEPMAVFTLELARSPAKASAPEGPVLLVAVPQARPGFDTERMAYLRKPNQIEYFARHRWVNSPSRMLAPLLVQGLEASGGFSAVVQAPTVVRASWRLETEIVKAQQDFLQQPSRAQLELRAQLINVLTQKPVAVRQFDASVTAASEDPRSGAEAMNAALGQIIPQLAQWAVQATRAPAK